MRIRALALPTLCLAAGALLLAPAESIGFTTIGGSLSLTHRDVRVFDNFTDPSANNNTSSDPDWPGFNGAELAIWKACGEWSSELHGLTGNGDPHQPGDLGSGGANFDISWQGNAPGIGNTNSKTHSEISGNGNGTLAFTETPISDGWRIRYYRDPWIWQDGPGTGIGTGNNIDLQGVACHEYGHALGLGHSAVANSTMGAYISGNAVTARSLHADDQAGVQFIYDVIDLTKKPHIDNVTLVAGVVTVTGTQFAATANELWFTGSGGGRVTVGGLASNGSVISALVPVSAGPGDIQVKKGGVTGKKGLSNAFPFDPGGGGGSDPFARALNIDIGTDFGTPGSGQGQAANSVGVWNAITPPAASVRLVDLAGAATAAVVTNTGINGEYSFNNANTTGGAEKLMDDLEDIGCTGGDNSTWTISGMEAGLYDVYVYAWAPDDRVNYLTDVVVAGGSMGTQTSGGVLWSGAQVTGKTYVVDQTSVASDGGAIAVTVTTNSGCGSINGIQIVPALTCGTAVNYCTAGTSASGCMGTVVAGGTPSATAPNGFTLTGLGIEGNKDAIFFWGTNGRQANPWGSSSSLQCVVPPAIRGGLLPLTGTTGQCDAAPSQDLNALWCPTCPRPQKNPGAGSTVNAQCWYRDPFSTSNQTTALSDGIEFVLCP
jgi:hypothetical protein